MGLVADLFKRVESRQAMLFENISDDDKAKLDKVELKIAELRVTGTEGGVFYFRFKENHLEMLDDAPDVPWDEMDKILLDGDGFNYMGGDDVLFDVIDKDLSPRAAVSKKYFTINSSKILYTTSEFAQVFEQYLDILQRITQWHKGPSRGS